MMGRTSRNRFFRIIGALLRTFDDIVWLFRKKILITAWCNYDGLKLMPNNWGDDINVCFLGEIVNKRIFVKNVSYFYRWLPIKNYSCIGSILTRNTDRYTEVWGSGLIMNSLNLNKIPQKIYSVRGPLTRKVLLENGIECPESYGDPALLVSLFYNPNIKKRYELGIVIHYTDENNVLLREFINTHPDVLIIRMRNYSHWHDIPNKIVACKKILSSSLHGLIIADSYGIPNMRVCFSDDILGGDFKFNDYFLSVDRPISNVTRITTILDLEKLYFSKSYDKAKKIDFQSIINSCPFKKDFKTLLSISDV